MELEDDEAPSKPRELNYGLMHTFGFIVLAGVTKISKSAHRVSTLTSGERELLPVTPGPGGAVLEQEGEADLDHDALARCERGGHVWRGKWAFQGENRRFLQKERRCARRLPGCNRRVQGCNCKL